MISHEDGSVTYSKAECIVFAEALRLSLQAQLTAMHMLHDYGDTDAYKAVKAISAEADALMDLVID